MKILKIFGLILAGLIALACLFSTSGAQIEDNVLSIELAQVAADSASSLIPAPSSTNQTILIKRILLYIDADATARTGYVTVESQTAARTPKVRVAGTCAASTVNLFTFDNLNIKLDADSTRAPGVRLFANAPSSDSIWVRLQYQIVPR